MTNWLFFFHDAKKHFFERLPLRAELAQFPAVLDREGAEARRKLRLVVGGDAETDAFGGLLAVEVHDLRKLHDRRAVDAPFKLGDERAAGACLTAQLVERSRGDDLAAMDDDHAVAGHLDLGKNMGRQQDGMLLAKLADQVA